MNRVNIVLVEPEIPQNTGNVARTCAVTGAGLHLVRPLGFEICDAKLKRAGLDYWKYLDITYYDSLDDFLEKKSGEKLIFFSSKARNLYTEASYPEGCYLVFGKETKGLPKELIESRADDCVRIPMLDDRRCINLSSSAAIGVYEALRQQGFPEMK